MSYSKPATLVVHAPTTRVGIVVGPGGATINNIRRIYQVQIDVPSQRRSKYKPVVDLQPAGQNSNQVTTIPIKISGNRAQEAANVMETLLASVHHPTPVEKHRVGINIPQEYHAELIGRQGKYAKRLEKRYGVCIVFGPSPKDQPHGESDSATSSSDASTVSIEGPRAGVEQAADELIECYQYLQEEHSVPAVKPSLVWVSKNAIGGIIGREGTMIESIQRETNTSIRIRVDEEWAPDTATVSLLGEPSAVAIATRRIQGIEAKVNRETTDGMTIHPKYYRHLIGPDGQALKAMILRAGGPVAPQAQARAVRFPRRSDNSSIVELRGDPKFIERFKLELTKRLKELGG
ncbi:hypothetical protein FS749_009346 [Ceratobasidium sp. UAMH 11750]|nr:hypothetical protein FS749_009346 [Ceratobasidium sp. UAMH 11750]